MTVETIKAVCRFANNKINEIRINQEQRNEDNNKDSKYFNANVTTNTDIKTEMIETGKKLRGFWGRTLFYLFKFWAINSRATERAKEVENFINLVMPIEYHQDYGYVTFIYKNKMYMLKEGNLNITNQNKNKTKLGILYKLTIEGQDCGAISEMMITSYINIINNKKPIIEYVKKIKKLTDKTNLTPEENTELKHFKEQYNKIIQNDNSIEQDRIIVKDKILQKIIGIEIEENYDGVKVRDQINEKIVENYKAILDKLEELKANVIKPDNLIGLYVNNNRYMIKELDGKIQIENDDETIVSDKLLDNVDMFIKLINNGDEKKFLRNDSSLEADNELSFDGIYKNHEENLLIYNELLPEFGSMTEEEYNTLKTEINTLKTEINTLKTEINTLKTEIYNNETLKTKVETLGNLELKVENLKTKVEILGNLEQKVEKYELFQTLKKAVEKYMTNNLVNEMFGTPNQSSIGLNNSFKSSSFNSKLFV